MYWSSKIETKALFTAETSLRNEKTLAPFSTRKFSDLLFFSSISLLLCLYHSVSVWQLCLISRDLFQPSLEVLTDLLQGGMGNSLGHGYSPCASSQAARSPAGPHGRCRLILQLKAWKIPNESLEKHECLN